MGESLTFAERYLRWWAPALAPTALRLLDVVQDGPGTRPPDEILDVGTGTGTLAVAPPGRGGREPGSWDSIPMRCLIAGAKRGATSYRSFTVPRPVHGCPMPLRPSSFPSSGGSEAETQHNDSNRGIRLSFFTHRTASEESRNRGIYGSKAES